MRTKILFNRKKKLNAKNEAAIEVEIYISRNNRTVKSTGIFIEPKYWDETLLNIKETHPEARELNIKLFDFKNKLEREYINLYYSGYENKPKIKRRNFYDYFENEVMAFQNSDLAEGTQKVYRRTLKYLREYKPKDFPIQQVDVAFLHGFNLFLKETKGLANNGRHSLFTKVRKVLKSAVINDLIPHSEDPFVKGFKIREIPVEQTSLTLRELKAIESLDMDFRPELILVRDMFLFQCYTAVRYGDLSSLTSENFDVLDNGKIRLHYIPQKTKHKYTKRISWIISDFWNGKADEIIKKYLTSHSKDNEAFFNLTNAFYNRQLKELQRFAGIKTPIVSHLGRKTCITLLVNDFGLDIAKAQMIAGHAKIEMTRRYLKIDEKDLSEAAKKIDWK